MIKGWLTIALCCALMIMVFAVTEHYLEKQVKVSCPEIPVLTEGYYENLVMCIDLNRRCENKWKTCKRKLRNCNMRSFQEAKN